MYSFSNLGPVCCSLSSSNCFLLYLQTDFSGGRSGGLTHLLKNFPQLLVIYTVKVYGVINKAEVDVFLELSCFFNDPVDVGILISGSSAFSKSILNMREFLVHVLLKAGLENFQHYFQAFEMRAVVW